MKMSAAIVYVAVNAVNGKRYVGITRIGLEKRRHRHLLHAKMRNGRSQHFYNAIRKHGENAFEFSVLCECNSYAEACSKEMQFIATLRPEYNMTCGGEGAIGYRPPPDVRKKMSLAKNGKGPWAKGECPNDVRVKLSASARARGPDYFSDAHLHRMRTVTHALGNAARRRPVKCLNDDRTFPSLASAATFYGISADVISNILRGHALQTRHSRLRFAYAKPGMTPNGIERHV